MAKADVLSELVRATGAVPEPRSVVQQPGRVGAALAHEAQAARLLVWRSGKVAPEGFSGVHFAFECEGETCSGRVAPLDHTSARALGRLIPAFAPRTIGAATSAGCGDRLGCATPGHVRAVRAAGVEGIFAQQSIREMERTARSPEDVITDAVFGLLSEGDTEGFGADADHLKRESDIDRCLAAGFTLFTLDPSEAVCDRAGSMDKSALRDSWQALDWEALETRPADMLRRFGEGALHLDDGSTLTLDDETVMRAAVKYGGAVARVAALARHLRGVAIDRATEIEVSIDETDAPTSIAEHWCVASELQRLGVVFDSLAPRFVGAFEKGVDYRGDLERFRREYSGHAAVSRELGGYKLSLHSGSDKFSIYGICAELSRGRVHLKTAGTSYLEALRCVAEVAPSLFRSIWKLACERYPEDRISYHVSGEVEDEPAADALDDVALPGLLDRDGARQVLHVTFGSVMRGSLGTELHEVLATRPEEYAAHLVRHFKKHLTPFQGRFE